MVNYKNFRIRNSNQKVMESTAFISLSSASSSAGQQLDTKLYLEHTKPYVVIENELSFFNNSSSGGLACSTNAIDISLHSFQRINEARISAKRLEYSLPTTATVCISWLVAKFIGTFNLSPTFVNPTFDGAIMLEYYLPNDLYIMMEFFNDGEIVYLVKKNGFRRTISVKDQNELSKLLEPLLNAGNL